MIYYIVAYDGSGSQILGNLDGQTVLRDVYQPASCKAWKKLKNPAGPNRPKWEHVMMWQIEDVRGHIVDVYRNPYYKSSLS